MFRKTPKKTVPSITVNNKAPAVGIKAFNGGVLTNASDVKEGDEVEMKIRVRIEQVSAASTVDLIASNNTGVKVMQFLVISGPLATKGASFYIPSTDLVSVVKSKDKPTTWKKVRSWCLRCLGYKAV